MRSIQLTGTPREIGRQHGEGFRQDIRESYEFYCTRKRKRAGLIDPTIRRYVERRFPDLAEEMRGIAEGAGMSYEQVLLLNVCSVVSGCTPVFFAIRRLVPSLCTLLRMKT